MIAHDGWCLLEGQGNGVRVPSSRSRTPARARASPAARTRVYRGQSNLERREERRDRLLAAGLDLFGTAGYAATSIEGICTTAGVTARHFYEHFASREALLRAVYDGVIAETQRAVLRALTHSTDAEARATAGVRAFVHAYLEDPRRARIACIEVIGVSADFERHRRSVIHAFAAVIQAQAEALAAAGTIAVARSYQLAGIAMAGAVNELMSDWIIRRDKPPIVRFSQDIVDFFLAVMKGSAVGTSTRSTK
jgi:AcrR family transcriptional regulator